jgi:hypothetical protein
LGKNHTPTSKLATKLDVIVVITPNTSHSNKDPNQASITKSNIQTHL